MTKRYQIAFLTNHHTWYVQTVDCEGMTERDCDDLAGYNTILPKNGHPFAIRALILSAKVINY